MKSRGLTIVLSVSSSVAVAALVFSAQRAKAAVASSQWQVSNASQVEQGGEARRLDEEPADEPKPGRKDRRRPRADRRDRRWRDGPKGRLRRGPGGELPEGQRPMLLDPLLIDRAMEVMRSNLPKLYERLEAFRRHDPERFASTIRKILPVVREYIDLRDRNPHLAQTIIEEFRIEERLRELSHAYRRATEEDLQELAEIEREIERLVHGQFELRFRRRAARLEEFERRLMKQRARLEGQRIRLQEEMQRLEELVAKRVANVKKGKVQDRPRREGLRRRVPEQKFERRRLREPRGEDGGPRH